MRLSRPIGLGAELAIFCAACHLPAGPSSETVAGSLAEPTVAARPEPEPEAEPESIGPTVTREASEPSATREASEPSATREASDPSPLVAPDGTVIEPCRAVPEGMACVPGGPFVRGRDDARDNERPAEEVWLQTYYMDLYEVKHGDFKACVKRKECLRGGPLYNDFSRYDQPIVGPNWYAAVRYCEVQGKHLPTEAQWEKAARGPDGALHPWGNDPATCKLAVIKDKRGRSCGVDKRFEHPKKGRTFVVGSRPAGVYGLYDMSGNAWEWVSDWASPSYAACGDACRGTDPAGPCDGAETCRGYKEKVVRGGSWYWLARYATGTHRRFHVPGNDPFHHFGFRCAASASEAQALAAAEPPSSE